MAAQPQSPVTVDAVIDEVLGGDMHMPAREQVLDEAAFQFFNAVRENARELDPETSARLNAMMVIPQAEKEAILQRTNRVARRVLRPLGYKIMQLQGLDPAAVDSETARAALQAPLTPDQQAAVNAEAERLFKEVYVPEMRTTLEDIGLDPRSPDKIWQDFGEEVLAKQVPAEQQPHPAAIAVPAGVAGALLAIVALQLIKFIRRRRKPQQQQQHDDEDVTDSLQDDASAVSGSAL